ncbi:hypothetical protein [Tenacibaculum xiamenense]|uniref:hypothetical protein n=1 Tax=Tenacibaculum xiamenense TaxID=1261553 RepID=UPI0038935593
MKVMYFDIQCLFTPVDLTSSSQEQYYSAPIFPSANIQESLGNNSPASYLNQLYLNLYRRYKARLKNLF